jgi:hypothetical protein
LFVGLCVTCWLGGRGGAKNPSTRARLPEHHSRTGKQVCQVAKLIYPKILLQMQGPVVDSSGRVHHSSKCKALLWIQVGGFTTPPNARHCCGFKWEGSPAPSIAPPLSKKIEMYFPNLDELSLRMVLACGAHVVQVARCSVPVTDGRLQCTHFRWQATDGR